jgi:hypothetical protein
MSRRHMNTRSFSFLRIETRTGPPIRTNHTDLRLRSQVVQLRLPGRNGGLIWNRPVAVIVRTSAGQDQILPIRDLTEMVILSLAGLCFASMFLWKFFQHRQAEA